MSHSTGRAAIPTPSARLIHLLDSAGPGEHAINEGVDEDVRAVIAERDQWRRDYFAASVERSDLLQTAHERDQAMTANTRLQSALDDAERRLSELAVQWGVRWPEGLITEYSGQDVARRESATEPGATVVCRLLGPWRDASSAGGEAQARPSED